MSKTVTIPSNVNWLEICLNGKRYKYQGGATVSVPDEIADLLANNAANAPSGVRDTGETNNSGLLPPGEGEIPVYTDAQGKLLLAEDGTNEARVIHFTMGEDESISADKTWTRAVEILNKGKALLGVLGKKVIPFLKKDGTDLIFQRCLVGEGVMTVVTLVYGSSGITMDSVEYTLTSDEEAENWLI